jgi:hypothetical protein
MDESCGTYGREHKGFCKLSRKQSEHLEEMRADGRIRFHRNMKKLDYILWNGLIRHSVRKNDSWAERGKERKR